MTPFEEVKERFTAAEQAYEKTQRSLRKAEEKYRQAYANLEELKGERKQKCPHDHCKGVNHQTHDQDEYGSYHTYHHRYVCCVDCESTLAYSDIYMPTYSLGWKTGTMIEGTILDVAPWWYAKRGTETRGQPYNLPGIREQTRMEKQYVAVPVTEYVKR